MWLKEMILDFSINKIHTTLSLNACFQKCHTSTYGFKYNQMKNMQSMQEAQLWLNK